MILFLCDETNVIKEEPYKEIDAGFCIVEKYDYVYQKELSRFNEKAGTKPYGLPYEDKPKKMYLGIGNLSYEKTTQNAHFYSESCLKSENEVIEIRDALFSKEHCDVVWFKVYGSVAKAPKGYESCGYDITYVPEINGAYSIIKERQGTVLCLVKETSIHDTTEPSPCVLYRTTSKTSIGNAPIEVLLIVAYSHNVIVVK